MRRLVYTPEVHAFVNTDVGVFDLSEYIVECAIARKVNQVSTAELTINNPKDPSTGRKLFTDWEYNGPVQGSTPATHTNPFSGVRKPFASNPLAQSLGKPLVQNATTYGPLFHPMDPIIITMTRLQGFPIQVFTGYLDTVPYVQIKPGTATLTASCTLKRLQYTFWDPGLLYVRQFLAAYGFLFDDSAGGTSALGPNTIQTLQANKNVLSDSGFADLLYGVLHFIGGWSYDSIYIEPLNPSIVKLVANLFPDLISQNNLQGTILDKFLGDMIGKDGKGGGGGGGSGGGGGGGGSSSGGSSGSVNPSGGTGGTAPPSNAKLPDAIKNAKTEKDVVKAAADLAGISPQTLWGIYGTESTFGQNPNAKVPNSAGAEGPFQFIPSTALKYGLIDRNDFRASAWAAAQYLRDSGANSDPHSQATANALNTYSGGGGQAYIQNVYKYGAQF